MNVFGPLMTLFEKKACVYFVFSWYYDLSNAFKRAILVSKTARTVFMEFSTQGVSGMMNRSSWDLFLENLP